MDDRTIEEILQKIDEINKKEQELYGSVEYLPLESSNLLVSLGSYNRVQTALRQQAYKKTGDYDDLTGKNEREPQFFNPDTVSNGSSDYEDYLKPWGKLDKQQKINRLMAYINDLAASTNMPREEQMQLKSIIISAVNERQITRKTDVEYCEKTGLVLKIAGLKQNPETKRFYIGTDVSDTRVTKTTDAKLAPVKKLDLNVVKTKPSGSNESATEI